MVDVKVKRYKFGQNWLTYKHQTLLRREQAATTPPDACESNSFANIDTVSDAEAEPETATETKPLAECAHAVKAVSDKKQTKPV